MKRISLIIAILFALVAVVPANAQVIFGDQQIVSETASGARSVLAVDLDRDADNDLVAIHSETDAVVFYRNLGGGDFQSASNVTNFAIEDADDIAAGSLSGNGIIDIVVGEEMEYICLLMMVMETLPHLYLKRGYQMGNQSN